MNKIIKKITWVLVIIIIIGIFYVVNRKSIGPILTTSTPIKIGAILPLTGINSDLGNSVRAGLEEAENEINKKGEKLKVIYEDSQGDVKTALTIAQKLIEIDKIDAMIVFLDPISVALAPVTNEKKIIQISLTVNPEINKLSDYSFTIFPVVDSEIPVQIEYVKSKKPKKIAIFHVNVPSHVYAKDKLISEMEKEGIISRDDVHIETIQVNDADYSTQLAKIASFKPDLLITYIYPSFLNRFYKQISVFKINVPILMNLGGIGLPYVDSQYTNYVENTVFTAPIFYTRENEKLKNLIEKAKNKNQKLDLTMFAYGYDSLSILFNALLNSNKDINKAIEFIKNLRDYQGVSGKITIDKNRNSQVEIRLTKYKNGNFVPYEK
jgi:branched-chain amino acid transport system substrate-binding protein